MSTQKQTAIQLEENCRKLHRVNSKRTYWKYIARLEESVRLLRESKDIYLLERNIDIQEEWTEIERRLPNVSNEEFERFVCLTDLLGIFVS